MKRHPAIALRGLLATAACGLFAVAPGIAT
jgi:hypothetical protein